MTQVESIKTTKLVSKKQNKENGTLIDYPKICAVCTESERQIRYHYGVFTCEACKKCFSRSLRPEFKLKRDSSCNGWCPILPDQRSCLNCRLIKCHQVGMNKDCKLYF